MTEATPPATRSPAKAQVRLTRPYRVGREEEYIARVLASPDVARRR